MNGVQFFLTTTLFGAAFTVICVYFDKYRHRDPRFYHKLTLKRKKTKLLQKLFDEEPIKFENNEDKETRIFKEIELAENCMNFENYSKAVMHFSNAISGCVDPYNLLRALNKSLPDNVFHLLIDTLEKNYQEKMKTIKENMKFKHLLEQANQIRYSLRSRKSFTPTANENIFKNSGFPPGITVDELFLFRRKKPPELNVHDNLTPGQGSYQAIKSEYNRRFRRDIFLQNVLRNTKRPADTLKSEGDFYYYPEYYNTFVEHPINVSRNHPLSNNMDVNHVEESENSDDEEINDSIKLRRHLFRRPTVLKLEGDHYNTTENAEKFVQYLLNQRSALMRHPTTLKLEGEMETKTENRDKYIPFEYQPKAALLKTNTNLHLEGLLDITTESREKFLPFKSSPRRPLTKRNTNLHLEGDITMEPEYRNVYIPYKNVEKTRPTFPFNNLKPDGFLETETEKMDKFVRHEIQPIIPLLRDSGSKRFTLGNDPIVKKAEYKSNFVEHPKIERRMNQKPKEHLKLEGDISVITESKMQFIEKPVSKSAIKKANNNLLLEGRIDLNPEYKNAYVNFYKDAYGNFGIVKDNSAPRIRRTHLKSEGDIETNPEYRSAFVDFPRHRPSTRKPIGHIQIDGNISNMTEKRAQFIEHPLNSKPTLLKRQTELKLEGPFECYPEYRRAYIDYLTREHAAERQPRFPETFEVQNLKKLNESSKIDENANTTKTVRIVVNDNKQRRRYSSLSPVPTTSIKSNNVISNIENKLFGPKLPTYPRKHSNTAAEQRITDNNTRERISRAKKRYGSSKLVENLAFVSPARHHISRANEEKKCDKHSFVVLGNIEIESCEDCNKPSNKQLFKEQKWMSSWNSTMSK